MKVKGKVGSLLLLACCGCLVACEKKSATTEDKAATAPSAVPLGTRGIGPLSCLNHDLCSEWPRLTAEEMLGARQDCNQSEGKFGSSQCPKDRAVASCSHESGGAVVYLYEAPTLDLGVAEAECKKTQGAFLRLKTK